MIETPQLLDQSKHNHVILLYVMSRTGGGSQASQDHVGRVLGIEDGCCSLDQNGIHPRKILKLHFDSMHSKQPHPSVRRNKITRNFESHPVTRHRVSALAQARDDMTLEGGDTPNSVSTHRSDRPPMGITKKEGDFLVWPHTQ